MFWVTSSQNIQVWSERSASTRNSMQEHWHEKSHINWQPWRARYLLANPKLINRKKSSLHWLVLDFVYTFYCPMDSTWKALSNYFQLINSLTDHFELLWINSKVNCNIEITTKNKMGTFVLPHWNFNSGLLELKASVLPMSHTDPLIGSMVLLSQVKF